MDNTMRHEAIGLVATASYDDNLLIFEETWSQVHRLINITSLALVKAEVNIQVRVYEEMHQELQGYVEVMTRMVPRRNDAAWLARKGLGVVQMWVREMHQRMTSQMREVQQWE